MYQIENGSRLKAFDLETGRELWRLPLGTVQKAPLVLADGKLYVGTESGKFFIVRPGADKGEVLSEVRAAAQQEQRAAGGGHARTDSRGRGRVPRPRLLRLERRGLRHRTADREGGDRVRRRPPVEKGDGAPAWVQVTPTELVLKPGQTVKLHARVFDAKGRFLREEPATWSLQGLKGTVTDGNFVVAADPIEQAGTIKATVGAVSGEARARVVHPLPWTETFESYADAAVPPGWINAVAGKYSVVTLDGQKVLQKAPDESIFQRGRLFMGPVDWSNYTIEADVRVATRRRQMGDIGITAQRYTLVLYGNSQQLKLEPWEPEIQRTVTVPFAWKADAWYHLKLRVENTADGKVRARGKAWPTGEAEPAAWMIDKVDPIGNRQGAPGVFAFAQFGAYLDNLKIVANQ